MDGYQPRRENLRLHIHVFSYVVRQDPKAELENYCKWRDRAYRMTMRGSGQEHCQIGNMTIRIGESLKFYVRLEVEKKTSRRKQRLRNTKERKTKHKEEVDIVRAMFSSPPWGVKYATQLKPPNPIPSAVPMDDDQLFVDIKICSSDFFISSFIRESGIDFKQAGWRKWRAYKEEETEASLEIASAKDIADAVGGVHLRDAIEQFRSRTVSLDVLRPVTFVSAIYLAIERALFLARELQLVTSWIQLLPAELQLSKRTLLAKQLQLWACWELCIVRAEIHERQQRSREKFVSSVANGRSVWQKHIKTCPNSAPLQVRIFDLLIGRQILNESVDDFGQTLCNGKCIQGVLLENDEEDSDEELDESPEDDLCFSEEEN
jgi:hypothetical protein